MHKGSRELYFSLIAYCTNLLIELYKIKRLSKVYLCYVKKSNRGALSAPGTRSGLLYRNVINLGCASAPQHAAPAWYVAAHRISLTVRRNQITYCQSSARSLSSQRAKHATTPGEVPHRRDPSGVLSFLECSF